MTEREKIIKIIAPYVSAYGEDEAIANALIAAGIGDISEEKHRAEVAEEAFLILWNECKEKLGWNIDCTMWYAKQAEKELAEEKKYDRKRKNN